jgi:hypothetical protein
MQSVLLLQWMAIDELIRQTFHQEDHMSKKVIDICMSAYEARYSGFIANQLTSKIDGKLSYLYYNDSNKN